MIGCFPMISALPNGDDRLEHILQFISPRAASIRRGESQSAGGCPQQGHTRPETRAQGRPQRLATRTGDHADLLVLGLERAVVWSAWRKSGIHQGQVDRGVEGSRL